MDYDERIVTTMALEGENDADRAIRPRTMDEYIGQKKLKDNLLYRLQEIAERHLTIAFYTALRDLAKRLWQESSQTRWVLIFV